MAHGDYHWAPVPCSIKHDPRFMRLKHTAFRFYMTAYLSAFEERADVLPPHYSAQNVGMIAQLDMRTAAKALQDCCDAGLLKLTPDGRIHVVNARENGDPRIHWKDAAPGVDGGQVETMSPIRKERIEEKKETKEDHPPQAASISPIVSKAAASLGVGYAPTSRQQETGPELEPTPEDVARWKAQQESWGIGELVSFIATGKMVSQLTDTLGDLMRSVPEPETRNICAYVYAKYHVNKWGINMRAAVLTARLKAAAKI